MQDSAPAEEQFQGDPAADIAEEGGAPGHPGPVQGVEEEADGSAATAEATASTEASRLRPASDHRRADVCPAAQHGPARQR